MKHLPKYFDFVLPVLNLLEGENTTTIALIISFCNWILIHTSKKDQHSLPVLWASHPPWVCFLRSHFSLLYPYLSSFSSLLPSPLLSSPPLPLPSPFLSYMLPLSDCHLFFLSSIHNLLILWALHAVTQLRKMRSNSGSSQRLWTPTFLGPVGLHSLHSFICTWSSFLLTLFHAQLQKRYTKYSTTSSPDVFVYSEQDSFWRKKTDTLLLWSALWQSVNSLLRVKKKNKKILNHHFFLAFFWSGCGANISVVLSGVEYI